ncbi:hypothetical protein ACFYTS_00040 [Nocardia sp. NPDC004151]|uniref:hypothetical protein n=1 Tax=Nocardia sp. NPDC004151 TaxID=3364304 RepID=UPI0036A3790E
MVGADGWPISMDEYRLRLCELEADVSDLEALGLVAIEASPVSIDEINGNAMDSARRELEG